MRDSTPDDNMTPPEVDGRTTPDLLASSADPTNVFDVDSFPVPPKAASAPGTPVVAAPAVAPPPPPVARPEVVATPAQPAVHPTAPTAPATPGSFQSPVVAPKPFSSIGSAPAPSIRPNPQPLAPAVAPTSAPPSVVVPSAGATFTPPSSTGAATVATAPKRRRWPLFLLALFTIAASGALSYAIATAVNNDTPTTQSTATSSTSQSSIVDATPQPAVEDDAVPAPSVTNQSTSARSLEDEPFARAAEIIRPSVVQLNLGQGLGTGVIINAQEGLILTAAHVVGNSSDVGVTFFDGSSAQGEVVGTHEPTDVAVVRVDPTGRNLVAAAIAEGDDVRVGQLAVAVGSPFGFDQTVTAGIISAVDRLVPSSDASFVQTDAPINPGNSGGPLINLDGEVVGINDLIFTESGDSAGVGFAISIDLAVIIADQLVAGVEPQVARLGVSTSPAANGDRGAQVQEVVSGSAADSAGLQVGDVVIALNGVNTRGTAELRAQILDQAPGSDIDITILRGGEEQTLTITLGSSN